MQVKSIAEYYKGSILQKLWTFIKLPFVFKTFVLSILCGRLRQVLLYTNMVQIQVLENRPGGHKTCFILNWAWDFYCS